MTTTTRTVRITRLKDENDWQQCRRKIEEFETHCRPNPWVTWYNLHSIWELQYGDSACWLVEIPCLGDKEAGLLAAALWRESASRRKFGAMKVLRTLDWMVFRQPPFLMREGREKDACAAMADALKPLARASGANIISLYNLDKLSSDFWTAELSRRWIPFRRRVLTYNPQVVGPCDVDANVTEKKKSRVRKLVSRERKIEKDFGAPPLFDRVRGGFDTHPELRDMWRKFTAMWRESWQWKYLTDQGEETRSRTVDYLEGIVEHAGENGRLDISLLTIKEKPIAGYLSLVAGSCLWMVFGSFNREYKTYYPGTMLFRWVQLDSQKREDALVDFGGETLDWKREWANNEEPIYHVELPVGGVKGWLWAMKLRLSREKTDEHITLHDATAREKYKE